MKLKAILVAMTLFLGILTIQAQEQVINIQKTDGTSSQTRVAELKQITFLAMEKGSEGLIIETLDGEKAGVLFESNPVVTISKSKMTIKPGTGTSISYEITNIKEITFGDASIESSIENIQGLNFIVQDGGAVLRGIPAGVKPQVYSIDGRCLPAPSLSNGQIELNRATLGTGIFIIKAGSFSTKIQL